MLENGTPGSGAAKLAAVLVGESPTGRNCPVTAVVISSDKEGDRIIESLEVKVSCGWGNPVRSAKGRRATWQVVAEANRWSPEIACPT